MDFSIINKTYEKEKHFLNLFLQKKKHPVYSLLPFMLLYFQYKWNLSETDTIGAKISVRPKDSLN